MKNKYSDRIVGGYAAQSMIPWQVYVSSGCGGIVLDRCTILSAAHCNNKIGQWIRAGTRYRYKNGKKRYISKVITHHKYAKAAAFDYDFQILKLSSNLPTNNYYIKPACLPPSTWLANSYKARCFVSGWGITGI